MAVTTVGNATGTNTITLPSGIEAGDLILVTFQIYGSTASVVSAGPSGYALDDAVGNGGFAYTYGDSVTDINLAYSRVAAGTESGASVTITFTGGGTCNAMATVLRNVDTASRTAPSWVYKADIRTDPLVIAVSQAASEPFVGWLGGTNNIALFVVSGGFSLSDELAYGTGKRARVSSDGSAQTELSIVTTSSGFGQGIYAMVYDGGSLPEALPEVVVGDAADRLRSSVSETTGSLLEAVDARAVDASVSEAYTYAQRLDLATLTNFREALRARDSATVDFAYYPRPRQNVVMENQYSGVTLLSRLSTYYPQRILDTVDADGLNIVTTGAATAQQIISHILGVWATDTGWLTYETVPDLRVRMPGLNLPSEYEADDGVATSFVVAIPQDGTNRKDALTILKELLSPFPGTVVRQNSTGKLEIVPAYGPDADETPFLTLDTRDLYSVSIGEPDPFGIVNRATVTSRGYERTDETAVMQPAWFQIGSELNFGTSNWYTPDPTRVNLQPPEDGGTIYQQDDLAAGDLFDAQTPGLWPVGTTALPAGDGISLLDGSSTPMVTAAYSYYEPTLQGSGAADVTLVENTIPFDGVWRNTIRLDITGANIYATIACRWNALRNGVEFRLVEPRKFEQNCFIAPCEAYVFEVTLNDSSVGYEQTTGRTGTFGVIDDPTAPTADDDYLPAADSGNAIADSQVEYGILERSINIEGYVFTGSQLTEIARAYVLQNITPKVVRELDVSALSGYRVTFDSIGRLVGLPSGDEGRVTGVSYSDDFVALAVRKTATVEIPNPTGAGFIPTTTTYHLHENGDFWQDFTLNAAIETEA